MPSLCLTPGDPLGVGPEITVRFLNTVTQDKPDVIFHVIGAVRALAQSAQALGIPLPPASHQIHYHDIKASHPGTVSYQAIVQSIAYIASGQADALVTGPIAKHHLQEAGYPAHGHTELLQTLADQHYSGSQHQADMLFVYDRFRMLLLTRHVPLSRVAETLTQADVETAFQTLQTFLIMQMGITHPRIAVMGVNPHAGEIGGREEAEILIPVMTRLNVLGLAQFEGPFPADALFRGFDLATQPYDAYVAAYHDQGLIPFKLIAGYQAVNVTLGLPFIRTSVSHGTAFDIAGQGIATEASLIAAVDLALKLVQTSH